MLLGLEDLQEGDQWLKMGLTRDHVALRDLVGDLLQGDDVRVCLLKTLFPTICHGFLLEGHELLVSLRVAELDIMEGLSYDDVGTYREQPGPVILGRLTRPCGHGKIELEAVRVREGDQVANPDTANMSGEARLRLR